MWNSKGTTCGKRWVYGLKPGGVVGMEPSGWQQNIRPGEGGGHHDMSLGKLMNMNMDTHAYDGYTHERV
jgi:hypothetical protein